MTQCTAPTRATSARCGMDALKGSDKCGLHGNQPPNDAEVARLKAEAYRVGHVVISQARYRELERDHEAMEGLLYKALGWEGRMNAAEQSLIQGHKRDAIDQQNSVTRERNEVKLILGKRASTNGGDEE